MARKAVSKKTKEALFNEYNSRCAICGKERPHIHHIDQDSSNNDLQNLIPLCPNCHLIDQHNPTTPIDPIKLSLFRRFKDPIILSAQFEPLFQRIMFLFDLEESSFETYQISDKAGELISFIQVLNMGEFYGNRLGSLINKPSTGWVLTTETPDYVIDQREKEEKEKYYIMLCQNRDSAITLIIELLRYQDWTVSSQKQA